MSAETLRDAVDQLIVELNRAKDALRAANTTIERQQWELREIRQRRHEEKFGQQRGDDK